MAQSTLLHARGFRIALRAAGTGFVLALTMMMVDVLAGVQLPQPFRALLPWLLVASLGVGITLLVGALGSPGRRSAEEADGSAQEP